MLFSDLGLKPELLRAVTEKGYETPTAIQAQAIPAVLAGHDLLAGAQTGTGKTAGFILPLLQKLDRPTGFSPRAVVLAPTRELAAQIADSARAYGRYVSLRTCVVFGGVSINPQIDALRTGCDLLIATPGRLLDLAEQRALNLSAVQCLVLDEADRMLDMGFIHQIKRILSLLPSARQNLMFSATYSPEIRVLASRLLRNPVTVEVATRNAAAERVEQQVYRISKEQKQRLLAHLISEGGWHQVLVFTRTKHGANRLAKQLEAAGIRSAAIHGNKSQAARVRALADFKNSKVTALVATEVAARGLDIKELPHVVNYELPNVPEDYVHRIGRTARAGATGHAISLVAPDEAPLLRSIENLLRKEIPVTALPATLKNAPPTQSVPDSERRPAGAGARRDDSGRARPSTQPGRSARPGQGGAQRPGSFGRNAQPGRNASPDRNPERDRNARPGTQFDKGAQHARNGRPNHTAHSNGNGTRTAASRTDTRGQRRG